MNLNLCKKDMVSGDVAFYRLLLYFIVYAENGFWAEILVYLAIMFELSLL